MVCHSFVRGTTVWARPHPRPCTRTFVPGFSKYPWTSDLPTRSGANVTEALHDWPGSRTAQSDATEKPLAGPAASWSAVTVVAHCPRLSTVTCQVTLCPTTTSPKLRSPCGEHEPLGVLRGDARGRRRRDDVGLNRGDVGLNRGDVRLGLTGVGLRLTGVGERGARIRRRGEHTRVRRERGRRVRRLDRGEGRSLRCSGL